MVTFNSKKVSKTKVQGRVAGREHILLNHPPLVDSYLDEVVCVDLVMV